MNITTAIVRVQLRADPGELYAAEAIAKAIAGALEGITLPATGRHYSVNATVTLDTLPASPPVRMCAIPVDCPLGPFPHPYTLSDDVRLPCCAAQPGDPPDGEPR